MITTETLLEAEWPGTVRLARHLGVAVPSCCADYEMACSEDCFLSTISETIKASWVRHPSIKRSRNNHPKAI
jgi:hypothetical protein